MLEKGRHSFCLKEISSVHVGSKPLNFWDVKFSSPPLLGGQKGPPLTKNDPKSAESLTAEMIFQCFEVSYFTNLWSCNASLRRFFVVAKVQMIYTPWNSGIFCLLKIGVLCPSPRKKTSSNPIIDGTQQRKIVSSREGRSKMVTLGKLDWVSRWWFQRFFNFTPSWGNDPSWLIFFKWVETTN